MPTQTIYGACPLDCPDTCGIVTEVEGGRAVEFYGNPQHPVTQGWLCGKVRPFLNHVYHPQRLMHPLRRVGPKGGGQWQLITWDEALSEIAGRWQAIIAEYGAEAILPYSYSGTLGVVQLWAANARLWNRMGASQLDRAICGEAAAHAMSATLGGRYSMPYEHVLDSQLVIVWGHNPVSTSPHFMPFLKRARRNGTRLVVIDPHRTRTARQADLHLRPRPGSDGALALGMARVIVSEGLHDESWLNAHTVGWPKLRERLEDYPPERAAELTGLPVETIVALAREYASTRPSLLKFGDGIQRYLNGGQTVRALSVLPALTGQYGTRGGGLAYSTSSTITWDYEVLNRWGECPPPGRTINMNRLGAALAGEASDPPIKSLFVFAANPVTSSPNAGLIVQGLQRDDLFTVVHELFMTDTALYADIVLPATSQLEQTDLHRAYGHTWVQYNAPAIAPLGECKSNWAVMGLLARAMGYTEDWLHQSADEVIEEMLAGAARHTPGMREVTLERLKQGAPLPAYTGEGVPFAGPSFPTPSGKVELYSQQLAAEGIDPLPGYTSPADMDAPPDGCDLAGGLHLVTPGTHKLVSSTFGYQNGELRSPFIELHPDDAAARGIADGDRVRVENRRGWCELWVVVTDAVLPGMASSPKGYWAMHNGGRNVNWTVADALGDMAGQSTFHSNRVWVRRAGDGGSVEA